MLSDSTIQNGGMPGTTGMAAITAANNRIGQYAFIAYVGLLLATYIGDRFSSPPSSVAEVAWSGIVAVLILTPWAWWFDHHRPCARPLPPPSAAPLGGYRLR